MAQYDIVFIKNDSVSGVSYNEYKLQKPPGAGYSLTQDPTSGLLSWVQAIIYRGTLTGVVNLNDYVSPGYYRVVSLNVSSSNLPDVDILDGMLTVTADSTSIIQLFQCYSRITNYRPVAYTRGKKGATWSTWTGYGADIMFPPAMTGTNIITLVEDANDPTARLVTDAEKDEWDRKSTLALGTSSTTAFRGDYGNTAYAHSQEPHAPVVFSINSQTGTTYTLVLSDAAKLIRCSNASAITLTIPPNSSVAFPVGTIITVEQQGAGVITVAPGSGVTINSAKRKTDGQYAVVQIYKVDSDVWNVIGGIE